MNFEKVKEIIVETINCNEDAVTMEADLKETLGMDSLDAMELAMAIEEEYGITIEEESLAAFAAVKDIVAYIDGHVA